MLLVREMIFYKLYFWVPSRLRRMRLELRILKLLLRCLGVRHKVRILIFRLVEFCVKYCACPLPQEVVCRLSTLYETIDLRIHLLILIHSLLEYLLSTHKP
jgi:hypothetical protein